MELTMFERLLQLPLFQGLTNQEVSDVMAHVRLDFCKYHPDDEVVVQDDPCRKLIYIISGEVEAQFSDPDGRFFLREYIPDVKAIEPYNMFGMYQKYSRTYRFLTEGTTLSIEKMVVLRQLMVNDIIKINLMNITSNKYQQTQRLLCQFPDGTTRNKIIKFILAHSISPKGRKDFRMKMRVLSDIVHETRLNVSSALNEMQDEKLITLQRGGFTVHELQNMYR